MRIAIDLRSLQSQSVSGVENYTLNLVENLLKTDQKNQYVLFFNSIRKIKPVVNFHFINSKIVQTGYLNKFLNVAFKFKWISLEKILGSFDIWFMPNFNQFYLKSSAKFALTVHDLSSVITPEFYDIKRRLWHKFINYRETLNKADTIFSVSEFTKSELIKVFGLDERKIFVVHPAIDAKIFNQNISVEAKRLARNLYGLPANFILFLNTLEPRKNLSGLIKAYEQANVSEDLVIAGKLGWKCKKILKAISASKKNRKIHYIGYIKEEHKPALIALAKVLVYPSFYEGFGFQVLEAFACGTPVIASNCTSLPEVASEAALLINPYNISDLKDALEKVLLDSSLSEQLIQRGLVRVNDFSWERTARNVLERLENLDN